MKLLPALKCNHYKQCFVASLPDVPALLAFTPDTLLRCSGRRPKDCFLRDVSTLKYLTRRLLKLIAVDFSWKPLAKVTSGERSGTEGNTVEIEMVQEDAAAFAATSAMRSLHLQFLIQK